VRHRPGGRSRQHTGLAAGARPAAECEQRPFSHVENFSISADGRYVAFGARTVERRLYSDVFVFDRNRARVALASRDRKFRPIESGTFNGGCQPTAVG
jgi:hypothetical protein